MKKLKEALYDGEEVLVQGIGRLSYGTAKREIVRKLDSMKEFLDKDSAHSLPRSALEVVMAYWEAVAAKSKERENL
jgi:hypothetical protein